MCADFRSLPQPISFTCSSVSKEIFLTAKQKDNQPKNRYPDVLPFERSRVILKEKIGPSDYINASFIPSPEDGSRRYISCQAPLPATTLEFWQMIWESNVPLIVMLTDFIEEKRIKAHRYWPTHCPGQLQYGPFTVELFYESNSDEIRHSWIKLSKGQESRIIQHAFYTSWTDRGLPNSVEPIMKLIAIMNSVGSGTLCVHCSAGIGRSGTLIAIHSFVRSWTQHHPCDGLSLEFQQHVPTSPPCCVPDAPSDAQSPVITINETNTSTVAATNFDGNIPPPPSYIVEKRSPSVFEVVQEMRYYRIGMVQTEQQFNFVIFCVSQICGTPLPSLRISSSLSLSSSGPQTGLPTCPSACTGSLSAPSTPSPMCEASVSDAAPVRQKVRKNMTIAMSLPSSLTVEN